MFVGDLTGVVDDEELQLQSFEESAARWIERLWCFSGFHFNKINDAE